MLKYPIVLAHGIFAHDIESLINFWGKIPDVLRENGADVFLGNTDAWGRIDSNAELLKNTIDKILLETKKEKVNIIAHSKGGIDARYFIWKYNAGDKVASLSTMSTPHNGAEIADLIFNQEIVHTKPIKKALKIFGKFYGDTNPDLYNLNRQLTTKKMEAFNKEVIMDDRVYYQSLYTTMRNAFDDLLFFYSYLYLKKVIGDNDGVISEHSATWGNNVKNVGSGISHAEIVDYKMKKISGVDIPGIYLNIVNELRDKGF